MSTLVQSAAGQLWLRRFKTAALAAAVLVVAGYALRPLQQPAWEKVRATQPELNLDDIQGALGQGLIVGVLGGFRTIIADLLFIEIYTEWEDRNRARVETLLGLVTAIDPRPMFFWRNGAGMIAYDIPIWRMREIGRLPEIPEAVQQAIRHEQAQRGIAFLDEGLQYHPGNPRLLVLKAQIYLNRLEDTETAAQIYKQAWEAGGPYFTARIHAELLRRLDRKREAYAFLKELVPRLPADSPAARREVVIERIRDLEDALGIPPAERFEPGQPPPPGAARAAPAEPGHDGNPH